MENVQIEARNFRKTYGDFVAMAVACAGLSILIGVISSSTRITVLWSQLVFIPSMLLGGRMIPYSMLPEAGFFLLGERCVRCETTS